MYIINRDGQLLSNYWKRFLYIVDENFYQKGLGPIQVTIETRKKEKLKVFPFICMDINY